MTLTPIWDQLDRACELLPGEVAPLAPAVSKEHQRYESDLGLIHRSIRKATLAVRSCCRTP